MHLCAVYACVALPSWNRKRNTDLLCLDSNFLIWDIIEKSPHRVSVAGILRGVYKKGRYRILTWLIRRINMNTFSYEMARSAFLIQQIKQKYQSR